MKDFERVILVLLLLLLTGALAFQFVDTRYQVQTLNDNLKQAAQIFTRFDGRLSKLEGKNGTK